jgi:hypothetical protein
MVRKKVQGVMIARQSDIKLRRIDRPTSRYFLSIEQSEGASWTLFCGFILPDRSYKAVFMDVG